MVTIPEYQKQLAQRRVQLEGIRQNISSQNIRFSQQQLRQGTRQQRQQISSSFQQAKSQKLKQLQQEFLSQEQLERELKPKVEQYKSYQEAQKQIDAYTTAKKMYDKRMFIGFSSGEVDKYLKQFYKNESLAKKSFSNAVRDFRQLYPNEKLIVDLPNLKVVGVESKHLQQSTDIQNYIKKINEPKTTARGFSYFNPINIDNSKVVKEVNQSIATTELNPFQDAQQYSYSQIYKSGHMPYLAYKAFGDVGKVYSGAYSKVSHKVFGTQEFTEQQKKELGTISGSIFLGTFFSPTFSTGTATRQELMKKLSKSKFDKLKDFLDELELQLKNSKSKKEQASILKKIKDYYKIDKKNMDALVKNMKDKGAFDKIVKIKKDSKGKMYFETEGISSKSEGFNIFGNIPEMKYAGTATGVLSSTTTTDKTKDKQKTEPNFRMFTGLAPSEVQASQPRLDSKSLMSLATLQTSVLAQSPIQAPKQAQPQAQAPKQIPKQIITPLLKSPTIQIPKQTPKQTPRPQPKPPKQTTTKIPIIIPKPKTKKATFLERVKQKPELIEVFGKRFGKDISLGKFTTQSKAEKKLESFLKGTLGRSGFLAKEGKKVQSNLLRGFEFRPSKQDTFRVVQKRKFSLGSPSEKTEIQYFRKKSGRTKTNKKNIFGL